MSEILGFFTVLDKKGNNEHWSNINSIVKLRWARTKTKRNKMAAVIVYVLFTLSGNFGIPQCSNTDPLKQQGTLPKLFNVISFLSWLVRLTARQIQMH